VYTFDFLFVPKKFSSVRNWFCRLFGDHFHLVSTSLFVFVFFYFFVCFCFLLFLCSRFPDRKDVGVLEFLHFGFLEPFLGDPDVVLNGFDEGVQRVVVLFSPDVTGDGDFELRTVEICTEVVQNVSFDRLFRVVVEGVPAYRHNHAMNLAVAVDLCPSEEDSGLDLLGKSVDDRIGEVGRRNPQIFAPAAEAPDHFPAGEKRQLGIHPGGGGGEGGGGDGGGEGGGDGGGVGDRGRRGDGGGEDRGR